jgi:hypothetical protein
MKTELKYNYHDGWLSGVSIGPRKEVTLRIILDSVWNNDKDLTAEVRFGAIYNYDDVAEYCDILAKECEEDGGVGARIDALHYKEEKKSNSNNHWIYFKTEGWGSIEIHCRNIKETGIEN